MLYINGRFLLQYQTGVNRFAYEMCKALHRLGKRFVLLCPKGKIKECYDVSGLEIEMFGIGRSHFWEQVSLPLKFKSFKGDNLLVNFTGIGPVVVKDKFMTVHDLSFMINRRWFSLPYYLLYRLLTPLAAATSRKIITVSEFSRSEIIRLLGVGKDKIAVIPNAVSDCFDADGQDRMLTGKGNYILAVSSIDPRKNFRTLLDAFFKMRNRNLDLYVVGCRNPVFSDTVEDLKRISGSGRVHWLGRVTDRELLTYYRNALFFVYPSLYEGFGMPPLEAMACGTPVVVSSIPSLEEVCGDAALYVNPYDADDIAGKMDLLAENAGMRKELVEKGFSREKSFSWRKSAEYLLDILQEGEADDRN